MLDIQHLSKSYGQFLALRDVSFQARDGEVFGLLGPNGAGKTTLLRILATLLAPTSGSVRVAGHDVQGDPEAVRRSVGNMQFMPGLFEGKPTAMRYVEPAFSSGE